MYSLGNLLSGDVVNNR